MFQFVSLEVFKIFLQYIWQERFLLDHPFQHLLICPNRCSSFIRLVDITRCRTFTRPTPLQHMWLECSIYAYQEDCHITMCILWDLTSKEQTSLKHCYAALLYHQVAYLMYCIMFDLTLISSHLFSSKSQNYSLKLSSVYLDQFDIVLLPIRRCPHRSFVCMRESLFICQPFQLFCSINSFFEDFMAFSLYINYLLTESTHKVDTTYQLIFLCVDIYLLGTPSISMISFCLSDIFASSLLILTSSTFYLL